MGDTLLSRAVTRAFYPICRSVVAPVMSKAIGPTLHHVMRAALLPTLEHVDLPSFPLAEASIDEAIWFDGVLSVEVPAAEPVLGQTLDQMDNHMGYCMALDNGGKCKILGARTSYCSHSTYGRPYGMKPHVHPDDPSGYAFSKPDSGVGEGGLTRRGHPDHSMGKADPA